MQKNIFLNFKENTMTFYAHSFKNRELLKKWTLPEILKNQELQNWQWPWCCYSSVFIVNFEQILNIAPEFLLLTF